VGKQDQACKEKKTAANVLVDQQLKDLAAQQRSVLSQTAAMVHFDVGLRGDSDDKMQRET
jgi:hypothetical protein